MDKIMDNFGVFDYLETAEGTYEYSAAEIRDYFAAITGNGILKGSRGEFSASVEGLKVTIESGEAWLLGIHGRMKEAALFNLDPVVSGMSRICSFVLDVDINNMLMGISVLVGSQAESPSLPILAETETQFQQLICNVQVFDDGTASIDDARTIITKLGDGVTLESIGVLPYIALNSNIIINGGFDLWQRGISQLTSAIGSDDRWYNFHGGNTSKTHSLVAFNAGQTDVPNNPMYFSRTVVVSGNGASDRCEKWQKVEDVAKFSGKTLTLSFYAKADSSKNLSIEFIQEFGSGGSSAVTGISVSKVALTASWQLFTFTVSLPSVFGKTIGNGSSFSVIFWFDAGSNYNIRTNNLGNQSGTFDLANVQLNYGSAVLPFVPRSTQNELLLAKRYAVYIEANYRARMITYSANYIDFLIPLQTNLRTVPTISGIAFAVRTLNGTEITGFTFSCVSISEMGVIIRATKTAHGQTDASLNVSTAGVLDSEP